MKKQSMWSNEAIANTRQRHRVIKSPAHLCLMRIPGHREDGRDTGWYLVNKNTEENLYLGDGDRAYALGRRLIAVGGRFHLAEEERKKIKKAATAVSQCERCSARGRTA